MSDCCRFASRPCSAWGKVAPTIITQQIIELKGWEETGGDVATASLTKSGWKKILARGDVGLRMTR